MPPSYDEDLKIGDRIAGRYEILAVVGHGSMGVVYKCRHDILGSIVAIKTLRLQRTTDDRSQRRFEREARLAHKLQHPNLISVQDFGYTANGDPYLIMDFVSGEPLFDILKRERNIYPERVVNLFSQVCDGLYHAHQRGVIHRDLKPANMLVMKRDNAPETIKIVDLGVAKIVQGGEEEEAEAITMTGEVCGSPIYLSPEQCTYQELDARTDIYSLGVCLYECLTGMAPLRGNTVYDTIYMHVHDMPRTFDVVAPHLEIPKRLEEIVFKCLAKQPKDRYETMMQLKHDLAASLKQGNGTPTLNVLPPELLFSGQNAAAKKVSGEIAKPERKSSGEIPKPGKKSPGELPRPGEPIQAAHAAQAPEEEEVTYRGRSRRQSAQQAEVADVAEPKKPRSRPGKTDSKSPPIAIPTSAPAWGLGKWVMIGAAGSVVLGLSIGFGFAAFLSMSKPNTPTESQMAQLPGQFPITSTGTAPKEPFTATESFEPSKVEVKPTSKASSTAKATKNTSGAKKGQKPVATAHRDLESFLPEEHIQDGSPNKFFSAIDMHGKGNPQMMPQPNMRNGARPMGSRSALALNSLVNRIPKGGLQGLKNFVASQGGGLLTGGSQSAPPQGAGLFPGGAPNQSQPGFSGFGQTPINGLQNNGTWLQPGQEPHPDGTLQADKLKIEGVQLYKNKQYQASVRKFEQAYSLDPSETMKKGYATALNAYANQLNTEGHYAEAVEYSRRALQLTPENTLIQRNAHAFAENLDSQRAGTLPGQ